MKQCGSENNLDSIKMKKCVGPADPDAFSLQIGVQRCVMRKRARQGRSCINIFAAGGGLKGAASACTAAAGIKAAMRESKSVLLKR